MRIPILGWGIKMSGINSESELMKELIRKRAYEIWEYHRDTGTYIICNEHGQPRERTSLDDWLEAEDEVLKKERDNWR